MEEWWEKKEEVTEGWGLNERHSGWKQEQWVTFRLWTSRPWTPKCTTNSCRRFVLSLDQFKHIQTHRIHAAEDPVWNLNQTSWKSIQYLLTFFSLDKSGGPTVCHHSCVFRLNTKGILPTLNYTFSQCKEWKIMNIKLSVHKHDAAESHICANHAVHFAYCYDYDFNLRSFVAINLPSCKTDSNDIL